jgi:outer membrane protein assembly factor BamB
MLCRGDEWPGWRGPRQNGVSEEKDLPIEWSTTAGIVWKNAIDGEGSSSPIVWESRVFVTSASRGGERRWLHCLDRDSGNPLWKRELADENPEFTSPLTGHAASTPVTDGESVYAWFGNAGIVCFDFSGHQKWHRKLGEFQTELGLASSPVIHGDLVYLLCDHDGDRFRTFDSFLMALNKHTGDVQWRAERPGLFRSWTTPLVRAQQNELVVAGEKQLRGYDLAKGNELWHVAGLLEWVAPSTS